MKGASGRHDPTLLVVTELIRASSFDVRESPLAEETHELKRDQKLSAGEELSAHTCCWTQLSQRIWAEA